jgi:glycosyltransferase involved in cell wall biosynthesis
MKLTILMPCLNESETLGICINKANSWLDRTGTIGEVVIADNGSVDGSQEVARRHGARVVDVLIRGYGSALYYGSLAAEGEYIIIGDSDDSYDFSNLDAFVEKLDQGFDLVMGNRFSGGIAPGAMPWKNKYIGNPVLTFIGRNLFNCPSKDFHCGLRAVTKSAFLKMELRTTGMEFASEMVIKANLLGMKITEVPTTLSKDGRSRPPHLKPWRDGWRHLRFMLLFSPKWLFIYPGISISVFGLIGYFNLLSGPVVIMNTTFDINTLFYLQAITIIGFMSLLMGLVARVFGAREGMFPQHLILEKIRSSPVLEVGSLLSISIIIFGFYLGLNLVDKWANFGFGPINKDNFLRVVSLSTLCITIGGLGFLGSLIVGFLSLPTRR